MKMSKHFLFGIKSGKLTHDFGTIIDGEKGAIFDSLCVNENVK